MAKHPPEKTHAADAPSVEQPAAEADEAACQGTTPQSATALPPAAETTTPEPSATAAEPPAELIAQLRAELEDMKDRALRYQAELDNYRKRAQRQIEEERRYANLPLMRDLLPVFDNVHRAIEAAEKLPDPGSLLAGLKLVAQQLQDVLTRYHCVPIEALHAPFDPHLHQAIAQQPSEQHPANTVLSVAQAGFQLHERVVRPSQVIVSTTNHANQQD